jgi:multiple sugar transport system permease protein
MLLMTQFLPHAMLLIPLFLIFKTLGLINTLGSVILAVITFQTPYNTVLMTGFMGGVPVEIEEAAMIDGCNRIQSIFRVVFPILVPGIVAAGSFAFVSAWKEYLFTLMFINSLPSRPSLLVWPACFRSSACRTACWQPAVPLL